MIIEPYSPKPTDKKQALHVTVDVFAANDYHVLRSQDYGLELQDASAYCQKLCSVKLLIRPGQGEQQPLFLDTTAGWIPSSMLP